MSDADDDLALAARLAGAAGELLLTVRRSAAFEGKALGHAGDRIANRFLVDALRAQRPDDGLLSEEMACDGARLDRRRVWIIDPVDGTREYGEGRRDWAVHVGLSIDGTAAIGAVALPDWGSTMTSAPFHADGRPPADGPPRMIISRTRPAAVAVSVADTLGATLIPMGSAGAKAMAVVRGDADIYLHLGGQHQWDNCAPAAVAAAAGLHVGRADGSPLRYNGRDTSVPDLLICRPEWAERVLSLVAARLAEG